MKDKLIGFIVVLCIGALLMLAFSYLADNPDKNGCIIGRDSEDCLEGAGSGHPLWND